MEGGSEPIGFLLCTVKGWGMELENLVGRTLLCFRQQDAISYVQADKHCIRLLKVTLALSRACVRGGGSSRACASTRALPVQL